MIAKVVQSDKIDLVVFTIDELICAIRIKDIQEIIRPRSITPVHNSAPYIKGVINLRGKIITIIDLRLRFRFEAKKMNNTMRIVILSHNEEWIGLLVDDVDDSMTANKSEILPTPGNLAEIQEDLFDAVFQTEDKLIAILNTERLYESEV